MMLSRRTEWRHRFRERDPEGYYDWKENDNLKYKYGITTEERDAILQEQEGLCGCCGKEISTDRHSEQKKACVDHCHDTKQIRGLLCHSCNMGIGKLGDNLEGVVKAARYLEKAEESISNDYRIKA